MEPLKETKQKPTIRCKKVQTAKVSTPPRERKGAEGVHIHEVWHSIFVKRQKIPIFMSSNHHSYWKVKITLVLQFSNNFPQNSDSWSCARRRREDPTHRGAEATSIEAVGKAEAERMRLKASAYKQYGEAAMLSLVLETLPKVRYNCSKIFIPSKPLAIWESLCPSHLAPKF